MRLLFLSTIFPDRGSPTRGTFNAALCRALAAQRHQVRVISPRLLTEARTRWGKRRSFAAPQEIAEAGIGASYPTACLTPGFWRQHYGTQMGWSIHGTVQQELSEFSPDAILSYWAHPEGEVGARIAEQAGIPSGVIVGGSDVLVITSNRRRRERVVAALRNNTAVITVSEALRQRVIELGVDESRVHTIYQGIDESIFHHRRSRAESRKTLGLDNRCAHLVWVGRMAAIKGLDLLMNSAARLRDRGVRFQLHLLGDGPERQKLEQQVRDLKLTEHIHFAGSLPQNQLPDWYRAADLTVLSSRSEGLPNVLRESLACGTPFVSTDVGSIREIAEPQASAVVPNGDPVAFAEAIHSLLNPEARAAAAVYLPRTWSDCARDIAQLLTPSSRKKTPREEPRMPSLNESTLARLKH